MKPLPKFSKNKKYIASLLSFIVSVSGIMVIIGWIYNIPALKSILPFWISMKFDTAICFLLSGVMLYFMVKAIEGELDIAPIAIFGSTLAILLFMGTLLLSIFLGVDLGVAGMFLKDTTIAATMIKPGQPSMVTMVNFLLISLAGILALLDAKKSRSKLRRIGVVVAMFGLLAVVGYMVNVPILYYYVKDLSSAMAFHAAFLFILLGAGFVCL